MLRNKPHWDGHSGWNIKGMNLGVQPDSSSAAHCSAAWGTDSLSSVQQDGDSYLIRQHAEGLAHWQACTRCQQVSVSASVLLFWGSQALKVPTTWDLDLLI